MTIKPKRTFQQWADSTAAFIIALIAICIIATTVGFAFGWLFAEKTHERTSPPPASTSSVSETGYAR